MIVRIIPARIVPNPMVGINMRRIGVARRILEVPVWCRRCRRAVVWSGTVRRSRMTASALGMLRPGRDRKNKHCCQIADNFIHRCPLTVAMQSSMKHIFETTDLTTV